MRTSREDNRLLFTQPPTKDCLVNGLICLSAFVHELPFCQDEPKVDLEVLLRAFKTKAAILCREEKPFVADETEVASHS